MDLTGAERLAAWVSLALAVGIVIISVDMLTGGRLLGWSGDSAEVVEDERERGD
jgi:hypothetical protein